MDQSFFYSIYLGHSLASFQSRDKQICRTIALVVVIKSANMQQTTESVLSYFYLRKEVQPVLYFSQSIILQSNCNFYLSTFALLDSRYISGYIPELWDDGRVLLRLGALLRRDTFLVLEGGGRVGGLGWCGGVEHLVGLWGPRRLTGLAGLRVDSSERGSAPPAALEDSVLPLR